MTRAEITREQAAFHRHVEQQEIAAGFRLPDPPLVIERIVEHVRVERVVMKRDVGDDRRDTDTPYTRTRY